MSSPLALDGRVALVTGGARRIGRSVALRLAREGADIVFSYRHSRAEADSLVGEITALGHGALAIEADVTRRDDVLRLVEAAGKLRGRLDIVVNNVGMFFGKPFEQLTEADWDTIMDTNLKSQFLTAQAATPLLRSSGHGVIVNFASLGGLLAWSNYVHYCASKAGVIMLTRCLSRALAPQIRVNAIAPGTISFPDDAPGIAEDFIRQAPLARTGRPEDIAGAVSYLVQAEFVTGQILVVDGGRSVPA
jgi:NAD(P)-dependent dehydrogenase (short-subunit alcohol dehydrogenase family)